MKLIKVCASKREVLHICVCVLCVVAIDVTFLVYAFKLHRKLRVVITSLLMDIMKHFLFSIFFSTLTFSDVKMALEAGLKESKWSKCFKIELEIGSFFPWFTLMWV